MNNNDEVLKNMARIARSAREFFAEAQPRVRDPEVRAAFAYIGDVKARLLRDLAPWLPPAEHGGENHENHDHADRTSPAALAEKMYASARRSFRGDAPAAVANELGFGEAQLCRLLERAFDAADTPALQQVLKSYYAELLICRQAMSRLRARLAA